MHFHGDKFAGESRVEEEMAQLPGVLGHEFPHEILRLLGNFLEKIVGEVESTAADVAEGFLLGVASERRAACQQHVQQHADRPHVRRQAYRLVVEHFRG